ncbi:MAG: HEPN domain-containing protein [Bryobacteraceae bacterium]
MTGRAEVTRLKKRLDDTFQRIKELESSPDLEVRSDFARYLCVLVSGYLEKAVIELVQEHARTNGAPTLQRFVEQRTRRFANANSKRLQEFLGAFSSKWRADAESFLVEDLKDAVDGVIGLRHQIAHGGSVSVTYQRIAEYYTRVQKVVDHVADLCGVP